MITRQSCRRCGHPFRRELAQGLCPRCLLTAGLRYARELPPSAGFRRVDPWQPIGPEPNTGQPWRSAQGATPGELQPTESMDHAAGVVGDYELLEELGRGGMGIVYRARQLSLNRVVALKVLRADGFLSEAARRRFRAEAQTVAELNHPHIVSIFDTAEIAGRPCFAMEWVRGRTLADLAQPQPLAPRRAARYLEKIARAIEHAHSRGILHRDLKPSNVLVDQDDEPRSTDFGLAKHVGSDANLTLSRQLIGSPNFMAPEQAVGQHDAVGPRSDIYGLGATLFFLITGRPPFQADTVTETLRQLAAQDPVAPRLLNPAIPRDLETLCLKCLDKEPHRRYQSALEVAEELARFLRGEPIRARPLSPTARLWRWSRRKPVLASLLTGVVTLALVILVGAPLALMRIHRAQGRVELAAAHTARLLYVADMNIAFQALRENRLARVRELLERHRPQPGEEDLRSWEWGHLWLSRQTLTLKS